MKFSEILSLFRQGKGSARSHMKNLIEMAAADGRFDTIEFDLLKTIAKKNNISEGQLKDIRQNPDKVEFELPENPEERFSQFYDLVHMMMVDQSVHDDELKLCHLFAVRFGYPREHSRELITTIQSNIKNQQDSSETMKRASWMLN